VSGNIISNSNIRSNVESWYPSGTPAGTNNVVTNNCVYGAGPNGGVTSDPGFSASSNVVADPQFVNAAGGDYRLKTGSPCASVPAAPALAGRGPGAGRPRSKAPGHGQPGPRRRPQARLEREQQRQRLLGLGLGRLERQLVVGLRADAHRGQDREAHAGRARGG